MFFAPLMVSQEALWVGKKTPSDTKADYLSFFLRTTVVSTLPCSSSLSMSSADI